MYTLTSNLIILFLVAATTCGNAHAVTGTRVQPKIESAADKAARQHRFAAKKADQAAALEAEALAVSSSQRQEKLYKKAQKKYQKAITFYRRALKIDPSMSEARVDLAYAQIKVGELEEALSTIDTILERNSRDSRALAFRIDALVQMGDVEEAKMVYRRLLRLDADARKTISNLLSQQGRAWLERQTLPGDKSP